MRIGLSVTFVLLVVALLVCSFLAFKSRKTIGKSVSLFLLSLTPPVIGNLFLISAPIESLATAGCYIYFIGMDIVMIALIRFTFDYCTLKHNKLVKSILYSILTIDMIQILLNFATGHVFSMEYIQAYGGDYYQFVALWGQSIHRIVDYVILGGVVITFLIKTITSPKVYMERFLVILILMVAVAVWQSIYIILNTPLNTSMIGYGVFGVLVFLISIYYRPLRLLDRMLASIASKMPESILFFDSNNRCIWVNTKAVELLHIEEDHLEHVEELLEEKIGEYSSKGSDWNTTITKGSGEDITSYVVERHDVLDDRKRVVGYYISIRDNTEEQKTLEKETYNATHDSLTKALNRAGFDSVMEKVDLNNSFLLWVDLDSFKEANDKYGHSVGDKVLINVVELITKHFDKDDYVCRIGGDEFAVIINNADKDTPKRIKKIVEEINDELENNKQGLPVISISAGGAFGKDAENGYELTNNADHAMYETKFGGKRGFTLFKKR